MKFHAMGRTKTKSVQILSLEGPKLKPSETKEWTSEDAQTNADYDSMLRIPSVPPSRLEGCRIIEVDYSLKVRWQNGWRKSPTVFNNYTTFFYFYKIQVKMDVKDAVTLKDYVDITIGTIPLRENFAELRGEELHDGHIELTVESDLTSVILFPTYPDLRKFVYSRFFSQLSPGKYKVTKKCFCFIALPTYEEAIALTYSEPLEDDDLPPEYMSIVKFIPKYVTYSPRLAHGTPVPPPP